MDRETIDCEPLEFDPCEWEKLDFDLPDCGECDTPDWEMPDREPERGEYHYQKLTGLTLGWPWCYSAAELETRLNERLKGLVLEKLYIYFSDYQRGTCHDRESLNLSCIGGFSLLVFDRLAVGLFLDIQGMVRCRIFSPEQLRFEDVCGPAPEDWSREMFVVELQTCFAAEYSGQRVAKVEVPQTDMWGMVLKSFDRARAEKEADAKDLPDGVFFYLENGTKVKLMCDESEYCHIVVKQ